MDDEHIWHDRMDKTPTEKALDEVLAGLSERETAEVLMKYIAKRGEVMPMILNRWNFEVLATMMASMEREGLPKERWGDHLALMMVEEARDVMKRYWPEEANFKAYGRATLDALDEEDRRRNDGYEIVE